MADRAAWEALRVEWVGRKRGVVRSLEARLKEIDPAERREFGRHPRAPLRGRGAASKRSTSDSPSASWAALASAAVDVTLPGRRRPAGTLHPITLVYQEIEAIFQSMGYSIAEGRDRNRLPQLRRSLTPR